MANADVSESPAERLSAVRDLITMQDTLSNCRLRLAQYPWDFEGQPVILTRSDVEAVLKSFLEGKVRADDIEEWADLLEVREDFDYEEGHCEWLNFVLWRLSDQQLNGLISEEAVSQLLYMDEITVLDQ